MPGRLGELLVRENLITLQQLQKAQEEQKKTGGRLGFNLTKLGYIEESELTAFLSKQYGVPSINLQEFEIDPEVIKLVPHEVAEKHQVIPVNAGGGVADRGDGRSVEHARHRRRQVPHGLQHRGGGRVRDGSHHGRRSRSAAAPKRRISTTTTSWMSFDEDEIEVGGDEDSVNVVDLERSAEDAPVVKLVNLILIDAIKKGASDIHIEPYEKDFRVRYRIDGVLYEMMKPPLKLKNSITSRMKIMSQLDIAERRLPQDGRIKLKLGKGREMDYRVSVLPTLFGEKIVMRLLDKGNLQLDMTKLGFEAKPLAVFKTSIKRPYGMCLVTGPTGSGKTTTLYSALSELNKSTVNISTAEDPVEYNLHGINQVQMHDDIGLNFAAALRAFLRQDPNIIMVGEIRDFETAEIAVKAALTGHMVLSTLHTNDAPSTVSRLLNMGIEPFLVTASVNLILAQRLGRRICNECKTPLDVPESALLDIQIKPQEIGSFQVFKGQGCATCSETGYKGRVALYEVMDFTEELKEFVINGASAAEIKAEAIRLGMQTLRMSALNKLREGVTTIEEVTRVSAHD
jgi:type IV pilus assembly protein PilB